MPTWNVDNTRHAERLIALFRFEVASGSNGQELLDGLLELIEECRNFDLTAEEATEQGIALASGIIRGFVELGAGGRESIESTIERWAAERRRCEGIVAIAEADAWRDDDDEVAVAPEAA